MPGRRHLRVITSDGITNELPFEVLTRPDAGREHFRGSGWPAVVAGTLSKPGEVDTFWLRVSANETWTFEVNAGTAGFDPAISIYERSASWFDPNRLERIAFNDEPLHFPGLSPEPRLSYRFERPANMPYRYQVSRDRVDRTVSMRCASRAVRRRPLLCIPLQRPGGKNASLPNPDAGLAGATLESRCSGKGSNSPRPTKPQQPTLGNSERRPCLPWCMGAS